MFDFSCPEITLSEQEVSDNSGHFGTEVQESHSQWGRAGQDDEREGAGRDLQWCRTGGKG